MPAPAATRLTALFTKHPTPGTVKTRLCPPLTPGQAARLAEGMLRDAVARSSAGAWRTALVFAPRESAFWFRATFAELEEQVPQVEGGLGARLANYVEGVFARQTAATLVVIGSDQPLVPLARLEEAHRALEAGVECVLGPDRGGGYYLIGLRRSVPELFTHVPMSSAGMCAATEELARSLGLGVERLAEHSDVDVPEDLERLRAALSGPRDAPAFTRHTRRALLELGLLR
jgi:rSAM/selenodomain-associated transferase 1